MTSTAIPRRTGSSVQTGVQAIGRLLVAQHLCDRAAGRTTATFVSGYRGSPLGGLDQTLTAMPGGLAQHGITLVPGLNEELGATAVWGSQSRLSAGPDGPDGVVGVWYGKAPGLDRAADAVRHGNLVGAHPRGGVLALVGDDPGAKSSTLPSASERTLAALGLPVLHPRTGAEVVRLGLFGIALSRATGFWVGMKLVSDLADGLWTIDDDVADLTVVVPPTTWQGMPWSYSQAHAGTVPWTRDAEAELTGPRRQALQDVADANPVDVIEVDPPDARLGIVAAGRVFDATVEALHGLGLDKDALHEAGIRLYRLGLVHPIARERMRRFAAGVGAVLVVEEKGPFVEDQVRSVLYGSGAPEVLGTHDRDGAPLLPGWGVLEVADIAAALRRVLPGDVSLAPAPRARIELPVLSAHRTAYFCSGCPHNRSTVVPEGSLAGGGIGCHAMAMRMPHLTEQMVGITQMGGEGAQWIGQAPYTDVGHMFQNMGDGTYFHSGQLAVQACVAARVNITFKILYNGFVAMTGGQDVDGVLPVPDLTRKLAAEGVAKIIVCADEPGRYGRSARFAPGVRVWSRDRLDEAQRELRDVPGVTVLIYDQVCAAEARRLRKRGTLPARTELVMIDQEVCEGCGDCGVKSNCLSVQPVATEFGRKTRIDQTSCNLDYSCVDGDCPAFVLAERDGRSPARTDPPSAPEPERPRDADRFQLLLAGIGGTGVVSVNRILASAARAAGYRVSGLDQTGLSQKAGPVTSHLVLSRTEQPSNRVLDGGVDCYLALDALVAAEHDLIVQLNPERTVTVGSTSRTPTGAEVRDVAAASPPLADLVARIRSASARHHQLDSVSVATALFGTATAANLILVGAAYQHGGLPLTATGIEAAITEYGVAVEANVAAFRWGRAIAYDAANDPTGAAAPEPVAPELLAASPLTGETRRLAEVRAARLVQYQGPRLARRYVGAVEAAWAAERRLGAGTDFSEAVARGLHHVLAYKDEYEVARLLTRDTGRVAAELGGPVCRVRYRLHPPVLRALGVRRKISVSSRFDPLLRALAAGRVLRGTPLDPFGFAHVRRAERALAADYERLVRTLAADLDAETLPAAVRAAALVEEVRGYEELKLARIARYRDQLAALPLDLQPTEKDEQP